MELLQRENPRTIRLIEYLKMLIDKQAGKAEFQAYEADLHSTNPFEVNDVLDHILSRCEDVESLTIPVAQFIRAVSKSLETYQKPAYPTEHLLHSLSAENRELQEFSSHMQKLSLAIQQLERRSVQEQSSSTEESSTAKDPGQSESLETLKALIASNETLSSHYVRLQNELFPLFEEAEAHHSCVKLMWALQDRTLALRKEVLSVHSSIAEFWKTFGQFYFHVQILLYREEHILFPVAYGRIPKERATEKGIPANVQDDKQFRLEPALFVSPTGSLDHAVLEQVFKLLPLDIAFIGGDDRLQFYSDPPRGSFHGRPS
ncbi:MAG: hypothetical protein JEY71_15730 [Sphaerochaeta sp.]|nr:hypothetical protein [Sphaerochaeta sp.]